MPLDPVVNFFRSQIATLPLASGGVTMVITTGDGNKLPNPATDGAFNLVIYNANDPFVTPEIVRVTAKSGDSLTITRAQEGTTATNKTAGNTWFVELVNTAKMIQNIDTNKVEKTGDTMTGTLTATKLIPSGNVVTGNGMYLPATNQVAFSTNGEERMRLTAIGRLGIGTGAPSDLVTISSDNPVIRLVDTDGGFSQIIGNTGQITFRADHGNEVANSAIIFSIDGTEQGRYNASGTLTAGKFVPTANTTAGNGMYLPTTNQVAIGTNGAEAMRIDASQRVAIGTTTQVMRFNVQNSGIVGGTARTPDANNTTVSIYTITCGAATGSTASSVANGILKVAIIARTSSGDANASYTLPFLLLRRGRSTGNVILEQGTPTLIVSTPNAGVCNIDSVAVALSSASNTGATLDFTITTSGSQAIANLSFNSSMELTQHQVNSTFFTITAA